MFILVLGISVGSSQDVEREVAVDFARLDSGTTVVAVSKGCNPPPYDVRAALGEGSHCSYPQAPPNWFVIDLGQQRSIRAIEIDWRYNDKSADDFDLRFGATQNALDRVIEVRGIGGRARYWYRVLGEPIEARFVKMEVLTLKNIGWTVVNRLSLYETSRIPRLTEHYSARYTELASRMDGIISRAGEHRVTVAPETAACQARVARTAALLQSTREISERKWAEIGAGYLEVLQAAYDAEAAVSFAIQQAAMPDAPAWVAAVNNMTHAFRHIWPRNTAPELALTCARNEWESGQIVIGAPAGPLSEVNVTWQRLRGPVTLDDDALDVKLVAYLRTVAAPYVTHHIGWWPDGLSPLAPFALPAGEVQPLWVTAKIPADAPPGEYSSTVSIQAAGRPRQQIPITVKVWDFELPTEISLPNIFSLSQMLVEAWYRAEKLTWADLKHTYYDFWLDRRLNPTSLYGVKLPRSEDLDYCLARGMNTFILQYVYSKSVREEEKFQRLLGQLAEWDPILRKGGLFDKAMVYLADEPAKKESVTSEINRRARIIGERFPDMRRFIVLTRPVDLAFGGNVDVWCPSVAAMRPEDVRAVHRRGEKCWWYTVGAFYGLDRPLAESRSMPWLTWKDELDGILLWLLQSGWRGKNKPSKFKPVPGRTMWPDFTVAGHGGYNGIGNLCYPGANGEPWSSMRLEVLRESMEDYEYLALLKKTLAARPAEEYAPLLEVPDKFAVKYGIGETGQFIIDRRRRLGEVLDHLLGSVPGRRSRARTPHPLGTHAIDRTRQHAP